MMLKEAISFFKIDNSAEKITRTRTVISRPNEADSNNEQEKQSGFVAAANGKGHNIEDQIL